MQVSIVGYEKECSCDHCGRDLQHGVITDVLGTIGADCFNKLIVADRKRFSQGKPGAAYVRQLAKMIVRDNIATLNNYGYGKEHFVFTLAQ